MTWLKRRAVGIARCMLRALRSRIRANGRSDRNSIESLAALGYGDVARLLRLRVDGCADREDVIEKPRRF